MTERETPAIHIPAEIVEAEAVPDDLDSSVLGPYVFPTPRRRRLSGFVYLGAGALAGLGTFFGLPWTMALVAVAFAVVAAWHFASAWPLTIGDEQALDSAARAVAFPVGHSSGAVRFEGWRSRPIWNVLVYSADDPPSRRALVLVDAVTGELHAEPYDEELET